MVKYLPYPADSEVNITDHPGDGVENCLHPVSATDTVAIQLRNYSSRYIDVCKRVTAIGVLSHGSKSKIMLSLCAR